MKSFMEKLSHKIAIVTGASSGIAMGIAQKFCQYGASVILIDEMDEKFALAEYTEKCYSSYYKADVTDSEQISEVCSQIAEKYGKIDALAYANMYGKVQGFEEKDSISVRDRSFSVNVLGAWNTIAAVLPFMKKEGGAIVIVGSATGYLVADAYETAYAASKAALVGLTKSLAVEYAPYNIRINTICQGYIRTQICEQAAQAKNPENPQAVLDAMAAGIPMKRLGTCQEIGEAAAFLVSHESSYITGIQLVIDGGNSIPETNLTGQ